MSGFNPTNPAHGTRIVGIKPDLQNPHSGPAGHSQ